MINNNTIIAAAALTKKACCGLVVQLNIWIGNTVNSSSGDWAINGTYANAPFAIKGAVSPIALDIDNITPVNIPPTE